MNHLLVISSYPRKGTTHDNLVVGVATYTKNTLKALLSAHKQTAITVLAEVLPGSEKNYTDEGINVSRIWQRKNFTSFFSLTKAVHKHKTKHILLELELAMFGGIVHLLPLPFFLLYLKLIGKQTTIVFHQVITTASEVHGQLNVAEKGPTALLMTHALRLFYRAILLLSERAIVFDEYLKDQLSHFGSLKKISVIPHGVEVFKSFPTQKQARAHLKLPEDRKILLYFGFLAWYKGTDVLVDAYSRLPQKDRPLLIIAGGPNPNHTDKKFYQEYIRSIESKADKLGITITGFVPEELISYYFSAADLCILPYRTFMSSSGPLSFIFSAKKPFLLSQKLSPVFATADIACMIKELNILEENLIFATQEDLQIKIRQMLTDHSLQQQVIRLDEKLTQARAWETIGSNYQKVIFG